MWRDMAWSIRNGNRGRYYLYSIVWEGAKNKWWTTEMVTDGVSLGAGVVERVECSIIDNTLTDV